MHHFYTAVRSAKVPTLEPMIKDAKLKSSIHMDAYVQSVIRRPLGKLLEFFQGVEEVLKTGSEDEVSFHLSYNKSAVKKILAEYHGKDIKKGLEALYKRVDKHFGTSNATTSLLQVVWRSIQEEFIKQHGRFSTLTERCYKDRDIHLEFSIEQILGYFSEIAKSH